MARPPDLTDGTGGMGLHIAEDLGAVVFVEPTPAGKCVHAALGWNCSGPPAQT